MVGMAYGTTIRDWSLVKRSLKTEILSLLFCIFTGAVICGITGTTDLARNWPTAEMRTRGDLGNFYVGIPVAFFSGLGVAVGLLDDQTSSLVGVAISASLLPPAVNAGIMWVAYAFVNNGLLGGERRNFEIEYYRDAIESRNFTLIDPKLFEENGTNNDFEFVEAIREYIEIHRLTRSDFSEMGLMSLCLTLVNIVLIWISSMLMFRMKEVLPIEKKVFWEDLGIARKIYTQKAFMSNDNIDNNDSPVGTDSPGATESPAAASSS